MDKNSPLRHPIRRPIRSSVRACLLVVLLLLTGLVAPAPSRAHIVPEEPWHPAPAAYLRSLFYANLTPIDWALIDREYNRPPTSEFAAGLDSAYQALDLAASLEGVRHSADIQSAIDNQDRSALYLASTRAVSQLSRFYLRQAAAQVAEPGAASADIQQAQRIYRAFDSFILQVDEAAARDLGRAWLELASSAGHAGVAGVGGAASDPERFEAARTQIEEYLIENYEQMLFHQDGDLAPLPSSMAADKSVAAWLPPGSRLNDQDPLPLLALNFEERGIDEADLPMIAYGDMLFDSPAIFGEPARSLGIACSTCHNRSDINQDFFIPGVSHQAGAADVDGGFFNPLFNDLRSDSLDIPSLRGIRFTAPYGRDGRFGSLREFTRNVIVGEFGGQEPTPFMLDTLVAYMLEFDWQPNSLLNKDGTLAAGAPPAALRGEAIFNRSYAGMGGRACSSCHIPGANFIDRLAHDIGSGNPASKFALDSAFDTPTLLNVAQTAPYMHDGALATLDDVVRWFDSSFDLGLSQQEQTELTAYLEAVGAADNPWELFDDENTIFALDWAELSTFLTTLDTLIQVRDADHALLLLDTVTPDLRLDASAARDRSSIAHAYTIADKLDAIRAAIEQEDWRAAATLNEEYKGMAEEYGPSFR